MASDSGFLERLGFLVEGEDKDPFFLPLRAVFGASFGESMEDLGICGFLGFLRIETLIGCGCGHLRGREGRNGVIMEREDCRGERLEREES